MIEFCIKTQETNTREEYRIIRNIRWAKYLKKIEQYLGEKHRRPRGGSRTGRTHWRVNKEGIP